MLTEILLRATSAFIILTLAVLMFSLLASETETFRAIDERLANAIRGKSKEKNGK